MFVKHERDDDKKGIGEGGWGLLLVMGFKEEKREEGEDE